MSLLFQVRPCRCQKVRMDRNSQSMPVSSRTSRAHPSAKLSPVWASREGGVVGRVISLCCCNWKGTLVRLHTLIQEPAWQLPLFGG